MCVHWSSVVAELVAVHAGVYNEEVFASLDWVLDQASRRNIRIIIPFEARACSFTHYRCCKACYSLLLWLAQADSQIPGLLCSHELHGIPSLSRRRLTFASSDLLCTCQLSTSAACLMCGVLRRRTTGCRSTAL